MLARSISKGWRQPSSILRRVTSVSSSTSTTTTTTSAAVRSMGTNTVEPQAPSSFSPDKMETDKRYQGSIDVPDSLLSHEKHESPFSIKGTFREGRAAYLDMSATTPLDPRVLDAMAPYMVS